MSKCVNLNCEYMIYVSKMTDSLRTLLESLNAIITPIKSVGGITKKTRKKIIKGGQGEANAIKIQISDYNNRNASQLFGYVVDYIKGTITGIGLDKENKSFTAQLQPTNSGNSIGRRTASTPAAASNNSAAPAAAPTPNKQSKQDVIDKQLDTLLGLLEELIKQPDEEVDFETHVKNVIETVKSTRTPANLGPMESNQRQFVYKMVSGVGLKAKSEGEKEPKKMTIYPSKQMVQSRDDGSGDLTPSTSETMPAGKARDDNSVYVSQSGRQVNPPKPGEPRRG